MLSDISSVRQGRETRELTGITLLKTPDCLQWRYCAKGKLTCWTCLTTRDSNLHLVAPPELMVTREHIGTVRGSLRPREWIDERQNYELEG